MEGEILHTEQQCANAEARAQATEVLRQLHAQRDGHRPAGSDSVVAFQTDNNHGTLAGDDEQAGSEALTQSQLADVNAEQRRVRI